MKPPSQPNPLAFLSNLLNTNPRLKSTLVWIAGIIMVFASYRAWGWGGVAIFATAFVTWFLLHISRLVGTLNRAANLPKGYIGSAVMLNAKLRPNWGLLHIVAVTKSLGVQVSADNAQPEVFKWTDNGGSSVTCELVGGKLYRWKLERPEVT